jgi:Pyruvate/2-oxoacid:ferredoxin oxidoreductase delta subunit
MNKIDLANIKKELAKRKAANYEFKTGGNMSKDEIASRTDEELTSLVENFTNNIENAASVEVKKIVDKIFEKYGEEDNDMIVISAAYCPERTVYASEDPFEDICFDSYKSDGLCRPVCSDWSTVGFWGREEMRDEDITKWEAKWDEYYKDITRLKSQLAKIKGAYYDAEDYYEDDNYELNEYWYGVIGITRDYKLFSFTIRNDGLLSDTVRDESGNETFKRNVIMEF